MYKGIDVSFVNLKTLEGREGLIVKCDIKYKGKKIATYFDDGNGGEPRVDAIGGINKDENGEYQISQQLSKNREALQQLQAEFKTLPKVKFEGYGGELDDCLDFAVDEFITQSETLKVAKKGLLLTKEGKDFLTKWKGTTPSALVKKHGEKGIAAIEKAIQESQKDGFEVQMQDYYISLGVNPEIFTPKA